MENRGGFGGSRDFEASPQYPPLSDQETGHPQASVSPLRLSASPQYIAESQYIEGLFDHPIFEYILFLNYNIIISIDYSIFPHIFHIGMRIAKY